MTWTILWMPLQLNKPEQEFFLDIFHTKFQSKLPVHRYISLKDPENKALEQWRMLILSTIS